MCTDEMKAAIGHRHIPSYLLVDPIRWHTTLSRHPDRPPSRSHQQEITRCRQGCCHAERRGVVRNVSDVVGIPEQEMERSFKGEPSDTSTEQDHGPHSTIPGHRQSCSRHREEIQQDPGEHRLPASREHWYRGMDQAM